MRISDIIRSKGKGVVTVPPDTDVRTLLTVLAENRIGAVVVSPDGETISGIVSERDIVRALAARGASVLSEPVSAIMTADVQTCAPHQHIDELAEAMTLGRFRHMPVISDAGGLDGIVSIGDVVKIRITELEVERDSLSTYIRTAAT
ncbi:CBS domain-containing protein [Jiangella sp. DSM 45060]|uniref:CBS domain-containing protein n=1 Tax=Jiangella sp. DSM 45060 TaxID=1798224 RepID=UPI00087D399D|nr:CBS domain-containing protein [Jiangella sp. DSM 45060]SDT64209.1 CBS domain-containing protein [Jiangella sp. DSM 45060]